MSTYLFNPNQFLGPDHSVVALKIIVAISIAVTSIPVISKIFSDLGIMHSRFAKIIVAIAGVHVLIIWVALAIASGIVAGGHGWTPGTINAWVVSKSLIVTLTSVNFAAAMNARGGPGIVLSSTDYALFRGCGDEIAGDKENSTDRDEN